MNQTSWLQDTISRKLLYNYFRNDTISVGKNLLNIRFFYPLTKIKGIERIYPLGSLPPVRNDSSDQCPYESGKYGMVSYSVYPLGKIQWNDSLTMVLWGFNDPFEDTYFVTVYMLNQNFIKVGHFGFAYSNNWHHCDDSIVKIMEGSEPWSYPKELREKGFLVYDKMVGSYYEDNLQEQYLEVEITDKGQFEVVKMIKFYEDRSNPIWSKKGFYISDKDGFSNLREMSNNKSKITEKLNNDTPLEILDGSKDWWQVKTTTGKTGYVHKSRIVEGLDK